MTPAQAIATTLAGVAAGAINTVVGSGTLITFPTLLALGYPPVTANVSNTLGLIPGSLSGAYGYRSELAGQRMRLTRLVVASLLGGTLGGLLLLTLPASVFSAAVPVLVTAALVLVVIQPRTARRMAASDRHHYGTGPVPALAVAGCGAYGGYFGAAQGVLLIATLSLCLPDDLQRLNAMKNVLVGLVNLTAAIIFLAAAPIAWPAVGCIAIGSLLGGHIGAGIGRRLPPAVLRSVIVTAGLTAIANLVLIRK
ncbi:sulfite exporter TauE/SafE family protein [Actinoallomurus liliacearum]|uniref:Probable membrane transporter protein n=1 Tax=Actinoallomurus liliacearum TaxID=1080073 RepID=A0ABP8U067_9ACTN